MDSILLHAEFYVPVALFSVTALLLWQAERIKPVPVMYMGMDLTKMPLKATETVKIQWIRDHHPSESCTVKHAAHILEGWESSKPYKRRYKT